MRSGRAGLHAIRHGCELFSHLFSRHGNPALVAIARHSMRRVLSVARIRELHGGAIVAMKKPSFP
jgi:hypothetical protein